jgi:hypothetical protein
LNQFSFSIFVLQGLVFLTLGAVFYLRLRRNKIRHQIDAVYLFCLGLVLFFPFFGLAAGILLVFASQKTPFVVKKGLYDEFQKHISERGFVTQTPKIIGNMLGHLREEIGFEPFIDIMQGQEQRLKLRVIEKLAADPRQENIRILKEAFNDRSHEVSLYAASALLKMDNAIKKQIEMALAKTKTRGYADDFSGLGELYLEYALSGLIDKELAEKYVFFAEEAFKNSLDVQTDQPGVVVSYAYCLLRRKEYGRCRLVLDNAVKNWPQNKEILFLRNELYFIIGEFKEVQESFASREPIGMSEEERKVWSFWMS